MAASNQGVSPAPPRPSELLMLGQCCPSREPPVPVLGLQGSAGGKTQEPLGKEECSEKWELCGRGGQETVSRR